MIHTIKNILTTRFVNPLKEFFHDSRAIGIILLCCTFLSLVIANTPLYSFYSAFWNAGSGILHQLKLPHSVFHFINDGLMAVFFFMAGMEIKRELLRGELSSLKQSLLPVFGAVGGMIFPALIFLLFNYGTVYQSGWAIPTATDIAFTIGIASLLGPKVPVSLKIFLTALAIIDDLGAIIVIAFFYGNAIQVWWLAGCAIILIILSALLKGKIKFGILQIMLGLALWYCMFNSGIHATVAGVIFAFLIPVDLLEKFEIKLHNIVYFVILPLFALANTALVLPRGILTLSVNNLSLGIIAGLFIGKPLGISLFVYILLKTKLAKLPAATNMLQMIGGTILAGIGFTMSIFISSLAFAENAVQDNAKIAVLIGSFISITGGYLWLYFGAGKRKKMGIEPQMPKASKFQKKQT